MDNPKTKNFVNVASTTTNLSFGMDRRAIRNQNLPISVKTQNM